MRVELAAVVAGGNEDFGHVAGPGDLDIRHLGILDLDKVGARDSAGGDQSGPVPVLQAVPIHQSGAGLAVPPADSRHHDLLHVPNLAGPVALIARRRWRPPDAEIVDRIHIQVLALARLVRDGPAGVGSGLAFLGDGWDRADRVRGGVLRVRSREERGSERGGREHRAGET